MTSISSGSVLYDVPGPRARARNRVCTVVGSLAVLALLAFAALRMDAKGQFDPDLWNIFNYADVRDSIRDGVLMTLKAFAVAGVLSLVLGVLLAVGRMSEHRPVRWVCTVFVELFRAVPLLITIYALWVLGLTYGDNLGLGGDQPTFLALVAGLAIYNGSVQAEVLRAGVNAVPRGQGEAAYALGMRKTQVMTTVLVPQAVRAMLPTIISQLVVTLKDTSLGYVIFFHELLFTARQMSTNVIVDGDDTYVPVVIVTGVIYVAMCMALSALATWIERRGRRARTGITVAPAAQPTETPAAPETTAPTGAPARPGPASGAARATAEDVSAPSAVVIDLPVARRRGGSHGQDRDGGPERGPDGDLGPERPQSP